MGEEIADEAGNTVEATTEKVRVLLDQGADPDVRADYEPEPFT